MDPQHNNIPINPAAVRREQPQPVNPQVSGVYYEPVAVPPGDLMPAGGIEGILSIITGVAALFVPIILGPTGIILGVRSIQRGSRNLGTVGITLSSVFMILGLILYALYIADKGQV